jgi:glycosyltransferase involved in cell wall biosynthesis
MPGEKFPGRLGLQQRVLPAYRVPFFDALAEACQGGLSVFAGQPGRTESIHTSDKLAIARFAQAQNRHFLTAESPFYVCWQSGLSRWLEQWQPDVLVLEANSRNLSSRLAVRWMHVRKKPVLGWGLGLPESGGVGLASSLRNRESLSFIRSLDGVIAYSRRGAQEYLGLGFPHSQVFVAPNAAASRPPALAPLRLAEYNQRPTVLFVGRLQARKRIDNLLQACAALPEPLQPRLWIVGDGPARPEFEALAQRIYPLAEFLGARHGVELDPIFSAADLFVLPGTGGLAVQQAMAYGLPVIVAQGDGTQDDLVRPGSGFLVPPGDLAALTSALQEALSDPARLRRMGAESFRIVDEEVNLEKMVEAFIEALNQVTYSYASGRG